MSKWVHINIWPDELIQLNMELRHHPELMERLANHPSGEWEIKLAEIAVYCEVILDGQYLPEEITRLAEILRVKLVARRKDHRGLLVIETPKIQLN